MICTPLPPRAHPTAPAPLRPLPCPLRRPHLPSPRRAAAADFGLWRVCFPGPGPGPPVSLLGRGRPAGGRLGQGASIIMRGRSWDKNGWRVRLRPSLSVHGERRDPRVRLQRPGRFAGLQVQDAAWISHCREYGQRVCHTPSVHLSCPRACACTYSSLHASARRL